MAKPIINFPEAPLLDRGLLLEQIERFEVADGRWLIEGVTWEPRVCGRDVEIVAAYEGACTDDFFSDDPLPLCEEYVEQLPFVVKDRLQGATLELLAEGEIAAQLAARWREMLSWIFANTLVSQVSGMLTLPSEATEPAGISFGTAATPLYNALANIESEFAERMYSRSGVIFLPPGLIGNAMDTYGVEWRDGSYRTPVGNRIIVDPGFYNADAPTGETASGDAEDWVYASGPVYYQASTAQFDEARAGRVGVTDRNLINAFAQSSGIMVFDPCPVTAVLTSYDPE
jgi:hypothetical protein